MQGSDGHNGGAKKSVRSDSFLKGWYSAERFSVGFPTNTGLFPAPPGVVTPIAYAPASPTASCPEMGCPRLFSPVPMENSILGGFRGLGAGSPMRPTSSAMSLSDIGDPCREEPLLDGRLFLQGMEAYAAQLQRHIDMHFAAQEQKLVALGEQVGDLLQRATVRPGFTKSTTCSPEFMERKRTLRKQMTMCSTKSIPDRPLSPSKSPSPDKSPRDPASRMALPAKTRFHTDVEAVPANLHLPPEVASEASGQKDDELGMQASEAVSFRPASERSAHEPGEASESRDGVGELVQLRPTTSASACGNAWSMKPTTTDGENRNILPHSNSEFRWAGKRSTGIMHDKGWEEHVDGETKFMRALRKFSSGVLSSNFDYAMGSVIVANALLLGFQVDIKARQVSESAAFDEPFYFSFLETAFALIFLGEFVLRLIAVRGKALLTFWMAFDCFVVASALIEEIIKYGIGGDTIAGKLSAFRLVRVLKIARTLRIIRVIRTFKELRIVVMAIWACFRSLSWVLFLLMIILYVMAILILVELTSSTDPYSQDTATSRYRRMYFPNIPRSLLSLFQTITGGLPWEEAAAALEDAAGYIIVLWVIFIGFVFFGITNVVTGLFVHQAERVHMDDERNVMQEEKLTHETAIAEMRAQLYKSDFRGKGYISREKLMDFLGDKPITKYIKAFDIDRRDVLAFFDLVTHRSNRLYLADSEAFLSGCFRLKGPAKNIDVVALTFQHREFVRHKEYDSERLRIIEKAVELMLEDQ